MGQRKKDPHHRLEELERWSARATLIILLGIIIDIGALFWFQKNTSEIAWGVVANALIAAGLIAEYIVILRAIVATGDANRESDEKVAAANAVAEQARKEAADARERTAEIERITAWRDISVEARDQIAAGMRDLAPSLSLLLEYQNGDAEAVTFGAKLANALIYSGMSADTIAAGANFWMGAGVFGVMVSSKSEAIVQAVVAAFKGAGIVCHANVLGSTALDRKRPPENLWLFVGPKPPPPYNPRADAATHDKTASPARESSI